jgi:hypothetical protein
MSYQSREAMVQLVFEPYDGDVPDQFVNLVDMAAAVDAVAGHIIAYVAAAAARA